MIPLSGGHQPETVTYAAACPRCGRPCTWTATNTHPPKVDGGACLRCESPWKAAS
jgi:hypothetical protein